MAKTNINFNNKTYQIDESSLSTATSALRTHLSTVMNGTGATINFGGTAYNIDSSKLSTATAEFVSRLGTVAGSGYNVVVDGVKYGIDSAKVQNAVSGMHTVFNELQSGATGGDIPAPVIGSATFDDGVTLTVSELWLAENVEKYGYLEMDFSKEFFFSYCPSLVSAIVPTGARSVYFQGCENLASVVLPSDMTKIASSAFWGCSSLTNIEIPDNVTIIDDGAFYETAIEHITIPANVTYIGYTAFLFCESLRSISFNGTVAQWNAIEFGDDWNMMVPATEVVCSDGKVLLS
jgi:hypothetical protein